MPSKKSSERECGNCAACCTTHEVDYGRGLYAAQNSKDGPLIVIRGPKPAGERCQLALTIGPSQPPVNPLQGRCGVYETRPEVCRTFRCLWLLGVGDLVRRPDRTGLVASAAGLTRDGRYLMQIVETISGAWEGMHGRELRWSIARAGFRCDYSVTYADGQRVFESGRGVGR